MKIPSFSRRAALLAAVALAAGLWTGCNDRSTEPITGPSLQLQARGFDAQVRAAMVVQDRHTDALLKIPGVIGTAVGVRADGRLAVKVLLESAGVQGVPGTLDGLPVEPTVTGRIMAFSDPTTRQRPAPLGFSIGHPAITAGSIGARVKDASGNVYALSNNHVLANSNAASIGDAELQPGPFDGGRLPADQIATLTAFQTITFSGTANNTIDAAIAISNTSNLDNASPTTDAYGTPNARIFGDANNDGVFDNVTSLLGVQVQKYGRTTRLTHGTITGVNATVLVCYQQSGTTCVKLARFVNQLLIGQSGFSAGGDSGSLIVTDDANKNPVALLFAGSTTQTIANRIDLVLNRFGVTVDGTPTTPVTDVAVAAVVPSAVLIRGTTVGVVVTIQNVGTSDVTQPFGVALLDLTDQVVIATPLPVLSLAAGARLDLTFDWNTTGRSIGTHTLKAFHGLADNVVTNNELSISATVTSPQNDVAITNVAPSGPLVQGATVGVVVTVQNVGTQDVTQGFGVALLDLTDQVVIATPQPVPSIAAGASLNLTFNWNLTGRSIGPHALKAFHGLVDNVAANNQLSTTVTVSP